MNERDLIESILSRHSVPIVLEDTWGRITKISVAVPDLRSAERRVCGDWGPCYYISVPGDSPLQALVREGMQPDRWQAIQSSCLTIESPMMARDRSTTPLFMVLPLQEQSIKLRVFYNAEAQPVRCEVTSLKRDSSAKPTAYVSAHIENSVSEPSANNMQRSSQQTAQEGVSHAG